MINLSPLDPLRISAWDGTSHALFALGRYEEGCAAAMKAIQFNVNAHTLGALIINAVRAGRTSEAQQAVVRLLKIQPGFRTSHVTEAYPVRRAERRDQIAAALRDAGLPD
jgi:adenylate cyclase